MKSKHLFFSVSIILFLLFAIACNKYYSKAIKDVTANKITATTITNLETAKTKKSKKIDSYYQLARIYHYNSTYQDIDKAKEHYEYLINNYSKEEFKSQFEKLYKKQSVNKTSFTTSLKDVNDLIDTRTYNSYVKTNTLDGYKEFVAKYPASNHLTDAKDMAYKIATTTNTLEVYKEYIDKFPSYKTTDAKDKAFAKACSDNTYAVYTDFISKFSDYKAKALEKAFTKATTTNTYAEYQNYLAFFPDYKTSEIHTKVFTLVKKTNTIEAYEKFITDFPKSTLIADAKSNIDLITVKDFKSYVFDNYTSWKDRIVKIDEFYTSNSTNKHIDTVLSVIPFMTIDMLAEGEKKIKSLYSEISPLTFANTKVYDKVIFTFANTILFNYGLDIDNLSDDNDSINFDDCNDVKIKMTKRTTLFNSIATNYSKLLYPEWTEVLKKNALKEEFYVKLCPYIEIYNDYTSYDDAKNKLNVKNINSLLTTAKYSSIKETCQGLVDGIFGSIRINCTTCSGTGRVTGTKCYNCKGRGEIKCYYSTKLNRAQQSSWGSTTVDAVDVTITCAAGRLKYDNYDVDPPAHYDEVCPECNGTMYVDCDVCNGYGEIDVCKTCSGSGASYKSYLEYYK